MRIEPATVVIPMAGRGQRFVDAGFELPKPLIPVFDRPMYTWAVDSIPPELVHRLVFVCLAEHLADRELERDITERYGHFDPEIVGLDHVTQGQACTVLEAADAIDAKRPLIIYNADTYCVTSLLETGANLPDDTDGIISVFEAPGDHWSFARLDETGRVLETAEKQRISPWATTGLYHFTKAADFLTEAAAMIAEDDRTGGEFYVAPLYNRLIRQGANIQVDRAKDVWVLGTPDELATFEARFRTTNA